MSLPRHDHARAPYRSHGAGSDQFDAFLAKFSEDRRMGQLRPLPEYQRAYPGLELEIEKTYRSIAPREERTRRRDVVRTSVRQFRWAWVLFAASLLTTAGLITLVVYERTQNSDVVQAFVIAFADAGSDDPELTEEQASLVAEVLDPNLRIALEIDPLDPRLWDDMFHALKQQPKTPDTELQPLFPIGAITQSTPVFQFRHNNRLLPYHMTLRGRDAVREFSIPFDDDTLPSLSYPLPIENPLTPGEYVWEISVDRDRLIEQDPPIVHIPAPVKRKFRLVGEDELAEIRDRARVTGNDVIDAYFEAFILIHRQLGREALQTLASVDLGDVDKRFKGGDRWRFLKARAHVVLRDRAAVEALYAEAFRIPLDKPEPQEKAKPKKGKKGPRGQRRRQR